MTLPPFDGTGWIAGMPGLPGGVTVPALFSEAPVVDPPTTAVNGVTAVIDIALLAAPVGPVELWYQVRPRETWEKSGDMTMVDATHYTATHPITGTTAVVFQVRADGQVSSDAYIDTITSTVEYTLVPNPAPRSGTALLTMALNGAFGPLTVKQALNAEMSGWADLAVTKVDDLTYTVSPDSALYFGDGTEPITVYMTIFVPSSGITYNYQLPVAPEAPLPTSGWTIGELRQFAADHEPPIDIPSSAHSKSEILAIILAYIAAHPADTAPTQPIT